MILRVGIHKDSGDLESTFPDLREALQLINEKDHLYLSWVAFTQVSTSHIRLEDYAAASEAVAKARELCRGLDHKIGWYQVAWLDGLVKQGQGDGALAERFLKEAHEGFITLKEKGYAAVIALHRAMLYHEQGRLSDVSALAAQAIPILEAFKIRREVLAALTLLREALDGEKFTVALLRQVRDCLEDLLRDPMVQKAVREI